MARAMVAGSLPGEAMMSVRVCGCVAARNASRSLRATMEGPRTGSGQPARPFGLGMRGELRPVGHIAGTRIPGRPRGSSLWGEAAQWSHAQLYVSIKIQALTRPGYFPDAGPGPVTAHFNRQPATGPRVRCRRHRAGTPLRAAASTAREYRAHPARGPGRPAIRTLPPG